MSDQAIMGDDDMDCDENGKKKISTVYTMTPQPTSFENVTWGKCNLRLVESSASDTFEQAVIGRANELVDCFGVANSDDWSSVLFSNAAARLALTLCTFVAGAELVRLGMRDLMPFDIGRDDDADADADRRKISKTSVFPCDLIKFKISISGIVTTLCLSTKMT